MTAQLFRRRSMLTFFHRKEKLKKKFTKNFSSLKMSLGMVNTSTHTQYSPCSNFLATDLYRIVWQPYESLLYHCFRVQNRHKKKMFDRKNVISGHRRIFYVFLFSDEFPIFQSSQYVPPFTRRSTSTSNSFYLHKQCVVIGNSVNSERHHALVSYFRNQNKMEKQTNLIQSAQLVDSAATE